MWRLALASLAVWAAIAHADVVKHDDAVDWWPGRGRVGPESCLVADQRQGGNSDGTWAYFYDAQQTCPMQCGGTGAWCVHEAGQWDCCRGVGQACTGCDPNPCQNGGVCVPNCNGPPICICPTGFTGTDCETPVSTTTTVTTTTSTTASTIPMPECMEAGVPCGDCGNGICLPRCDGITCQFICISPVGSPCESLACAIAGPTAVCVDVNPNGCVDGICDGNRECGFPCFGTTSSTTTTTTTTTTIITTTTTTVTTTTTTGTGPTTTTTTVTTTTLTTTTTTSTTTTTTTTSTTTTTIVDSVTILWVPTVPEDIIPNKAVTGANVLDCTAWTPTLGIQHATSLSFDVACPGPDVNFSVSIYNADGSTRITTTGQTLCTFNGNYKINTGDFSLEAGTKYQVCACGDTTNVLFTVPDPGTSSAVSALAQTFTGGELRSTGANPCLTGAPPLTTGALSATQHDVFPIILIGSSTP